MNDRTIRRAARLATNLGVALGAHAYGDELQQNDEEAQKKGWAGPEGRRHCLHHVATYTISVAAAQIAANTAMGIRTRPAVCLAGHIGTGAAHYVMDRSKDSATLPARMSKLPWMPNKVGYFRVDRKAVDQAFHWVCLTAWAFTDAIASER